jgi:hypothetical protein
MNNHVHLLIEERGESIAQIFKRLDTRYAQWFNKKYGRTGYLFQDRFKSQPIENDRYFFTALRYIYNNPVAAGMVTKAVDYPWSSRRLLGKETSLMDHERLFKMKSLPELLEFIEEEPGEGEQLAEPERRTKYYPTDREVAEKIRSICDLRGAVQLQNLPRDIQAECLKELIGINAGVRQLSRITGISRSSISRMQNEASQEIPGSSF